MKVVCVYGPAIHSLPFRDASPCLVITIFGACLHFKVALGDRYGKLIRSATLGHCVTSSRALQRCGIVPSPFVQTCPSQRRHRTTLPKYLPFLLPFQFSAINSTLPQYSSVVQFGTVHCRRVPFEHFSARCGDFPNLPWSAPSFPPNMTPSVITFLSWTRITRCARFIHHQLFE